MHLAYLACTFNNSLKPHIQKGFPKLRWSYVTNECQSVDWQMLWMFLALPTVVHNCNHHGQHCWDLPDTMCKCDMWVHGMYHKFVSDHFSIGRHNVMFSSVLTLAYHWEGPFTWPCCRKLAHCPFSSHEDSRKEAPVFSNKIQPWEEDIWWHELHSVTFPAGSMSNQSCGISQKQFNYILNIDEDSSRKSNWNHRKGHGH